MSDEEIEKILREFMGLDAFVYLVKRGLYWRPDAKGYTSNSREAGLYSKEDASHYASGSDGEVTAVPVKNPPWLTSRDASSPVLQKLREDQWFKLHESFQIPWLESYQQHQQTFTQLLLTIPSRTLALAVATVLKGDL